MLAQVQVPCTLRYGRDADHQIALKTVDVDAIIEIFGKWMELSTSMYQLGPT